VQWFRPTYDDFSTLALCNTPITLGRTNSSSLTTTQRMKNLMGLGATVSLLLINGMPPTPLSPVLLHFFIHDCNINAITKSYLAEWHPKFSEILDNWISGGLDVDLDEFEFHFSAFHDTQVRIMSVFVENINVL
jgi:hypothetical protein